MVGEERWLRVLIGMLARVGGAPVILVIRAGAGTRSAHPFAPSIDIEAGHGMGVRGAAVAAHGDGCEHAVASRRA